MEQIKNRSARIEDNSRFLAISLWHFPLFLPKIAPVYVSELYFTIQQLFKVATENIFTEVKIFDLRNKPDR